MDDLISRKAAIEALVKLTNCGSARELWEYVMEHDLKDMWSGGISDAIDEVIKLPSAQPERKNMTDRQAATGALELFGISEQLPVQPEPYTEDKK